MTVKELIEALEKMPPESDVYVRADYESDNGYMGTTMRCVLSVDINQHGEVTVNGGE